MVKSAAHQNGAVCAIRVAAGCGRQVETTDVMETLRRIEADVAELKA